MEGSHRYALAGRLLVVTVPTEKANVTKLWYVFFSVRDRYLYIVQAVCIYIYAIFGGMPISGASIRTSRGRCTLCCFSAQANEHWVELSSDRYYIVINDILVHVIIQVRIMSKKWQSP